MCVMIFIAFKMASQFVSREKSFVLNRNGPGRNGPGEECLWDMRCAVYHDRNRKRRFNATHWATDIVSPMFVSCCCMDGATKPHNSSKFASIIRR